MHIIVVVGCCVAIQFILFFNSNGLFACECVCEWVRMFYVFHSIWCCVFGLLILDVIACIEIGIFRVATTQLTQHT